MECFQCFRTIFASYQVDKLEQVFETNHYPDSSRRNALVVETGLKEETIQVNTKIKLKVMYSI